MTSKSLEAIELAVARLELTSARTADCLERIANALEQLVDGVHVAAPSSARLLAKVDALADRYIKDDGSLVSLPDLSKVAHQ